MGLAII